MITFKKALSGRNCLAAGILLGFFSIARDQAPAMGFDGPALAGLQDTTKKARENMTTIRYRDAVETQGKAVVLVLDKDRIVELHVDGQRIADGDMRNYQQLIDAARKPKKAPPAPPAPAAVMAAAPAPAPGAMAPPPPAGMVAPPAPPAPSDQFLQAMLTELVNDKLIPSRDRYDLKLSDKAFYVGGKQQPRPVFEKYKALYEQTSGSKVGSGFSYHISK